MSLMLTVPGVAGVGMLVFGGCGRGNAGVRWLREWECRCSVVAVAGAPVLAASSLVGFHKVL